MMRLGRSLPLESVAVSERVTRNAKCFQDPSYRSPVVPFTTTIQNLGDTLLIPVDPARRPIMHPITKQNRDAENSAYATTWYNVAVRSQYGFWWRQDSYLTRPHSKGAVRDVVAPAGLRSAAFSEILILAKANQVIRN